MGGVNLLNGFGGYWFTIVLFQMYLIYLFTNYVSRLVRKDVCVPLLVSFSAIGIAMFAHKPTNIWAWDYFVWSKLANYMQFFSLGIICSKYKDKFFDLLSKNWFKTIVIIGWIACMMLWYSTSFKEQLHGLFTANFNISVRYFGLLCVIMMFYNHAKTFASGKSYCKVLRFIGRRTLDIYMIHFFFLPNLKFLLIWISADDFLLQLIVSLVFTVLITMLCLIVSQMLRQSHTLSTWLFGEKASVSVSESV